MASEYDFIDINKYKIMRLIGNGATCDVYLVKHKKARKYYAAKVSKFMVDEEARDDNQTLLIFREVNLISLLNHPSIVKFVGYSQIDFYKDPKPTIITEYVSSGTLHSMIDRERTGNAPIEWDYTTKLIVIYGIASGMKYLHENKVIHRDLKPLNILLDNSLHPKISDFGLSKITENLSTSMCALSQKGLIGTPIYMAPEILLNNEYNCATDVYAFAVTIHEILMVETPYIKLKWREIQDRICTGKRPKIKGDVSDFFKNLIQRCWAHDPGSRPSFAEIVEEIKKNKDEIVNQTVDIAKLDDYIDQIDSANLNYVLNTPLHFEEFVTIKSENLINIKDDEEEEQEEEEEEENEDSYDCEENSYKKACISTLMMKESLNDTYSSLTKTSGLLFNNNELTNDINETASQTLQNTENSLTCPFYEFKKLSKECQKLVEEAEINSMQQLKVAISFFEGENGFPQNIYLGKQYLNLSFYNEYFDSIIYYIKMLKKGNIFPKNLDKANKILQYYNKIDDMRLFALKGCIFKKEMEYLQAKKAFKKGMKLDDLKSIHEYAKMLFLGQGIKRNSKKAFKYFDIASKKGFKKSKNFLYIFNHMKQFHEFTKLNPETQFLIIKSIIANIGVNNIANNQIQNIFNQIKIQSNKTEIEIFSTK